MELLRECPGGDRELCREMLSLLEEIARGERLAAFLALPVDEDGEVIDAVYAEGENGEWIAVSPHTLADIDYAVHAIVHELAHAIGLEEEEFAEALALYATNTANIPKPPEPVREAEEKLRENSCIVRLGKPEKLYLATVKLQE